MTKRGRFAGLSISHHRFSAVVAAVFLSAAAALAYADQQTPEPVTGARFNVLIMNSHDYGMPWQRTVNQAIYEALAAEPKIPTKLFTEFTGLSQFNNDVYVKKLVDLYGNKYADRRMDLIITVDVAATDFMVKHGAELFSGAPIVFISEIKNRADTRPAPNATGIFTEFDIKGTVDIALDLHPNTQRIALISGSSKMDRQYEARARQVLTDYRNRFEIIDLTGLPMEKLLDRAAQLPPRTIVLYVLTLVDGAGETFVPREILPKISQASNAPVYGLWDSLLGGGIVGGHLSSAGVGGTKAAEMGLRILGGARPEDIPIVRGSHAYLFDWRQLRRWDISERDLPAGSEVRFKEFTFLDLYKWHISGIAALLAIETMLILGLLIHRARCRRVEVALQAAHDGLEQRVVERTDELTRSNEQLKNALAEVKTLRGFIPICANCKKIRDDEGYWQQVEQYVQDRSEAQFSHSICPECEKKLYPQLHKNK